MPEEDKDILRNRLIIGRLGKPRGLKGELKVFPLTDDPVRFRKLKKCYLEDEDGQVRFEVRVLKVSVSGDSVFIQFKDIISREQAEELKNCYLSVSREDAVPLSEDTYFIADLIGCAVYDSEHGLLGMIRQIDQNSNADIFIVREKGRNDLLFPNLKSIIRKIDIAGRRVDVILPDGLYEIYRED